MFDGLTYEDYRDKMTDAQIRAAVAATGVSIVEIKRNGKLWEVVQGGQYNRRVHLGTEMVMSGPAAGDDRLKTSYDPTGTVVFGSISNCNGGVTPWGTMLSGRRGRHGRVCRRLHEPSQPGSVERQGWDEEENDGYGIGRLEDRFNYEKEPNEWLKFDWVVEIDPLDPTAKPVQAHRARPLHP